MRLLLLRLHLADLDNRLPAGEFFFRESSEIQALVLATTSEALSVSRFLRSGEVRAVVIDVSSLVFTSVGRPLGATKACQ